VQHHPPTEPPTKVNNLRAQIRLGGLRGEIIVDVKPSMVDVKKREIAERKTTESPPEETDRLNNIKGGPAAIRC